MIMWRWSAKVARLSRPARDQKSALSGSVATMREYTGTMARSSPGSVAVQASVARTTTSARTVPPLVSTNGRSPASPAPMARTSVCS